MTKPIMMTTPGVFQDYFYSNLNQVVGTPYKTPTNAMIQLSDVKYPQTTVMLSERKNDGTSPREWDVRFAERRPDNPGPGGTESRVLVARRHRHGRRQQC